MLANSYQRWPLFAVAGALLLTVAACAPNSVHTPLEPRLASQAEREDNRYGALLRMAASTRAAGDPAAAVKLYQQAITQQRDRPEAYVLLGDTLVGLAAFDDAARAYREALDRDAQSLAAHRGYARALLGLNRPEMAIPHYQAVVERTPDDVQARNGLGVAYDLAGQHEAAQAAYRAGLQIAPDSMLLRNNLGLSLALSGEHDQAIAMLRAVVDEPGARARNRQNLALAYGLAGNLAAAERISRLDLDQEAVENNLAYYATLAAVENRRRRAAALGAHATDTTDDGADEAVNRRLAAIALEGDGLELGLSPTGRWFVNLGEYGSEGQATAAWRDLRNRYGDLIGNLMRLAGTQQGPQPLLVGPLADAEQAEALCGNLKGRGQRCRPLPL